MSDDKHTPGSVLNTRGLATKREYVRELRVRGDAQALSLLVECLCDESWYLRELAEAAFLELGETGAEALLPMLDQGLWFTRVSAARVFGRLGYRRAVSGLLRLTEDANSTVVHAAREALVGIGNRHGAIRLAHALHRLPPDARRRQLDGLTALDASLRERLERLMRSEELMLAEDVEPLSDDSPAVRAIEGVAPETPAGSPPSPPPRPRAEEPGGGNE
jgi:HEAT repeat protein